MAKINRAAVQEAGLRGYARFTVKNPGKKLEGNQLSKDLKEIIKNNKDDILRLQEDNDMKGIVLLFQDEFTNRYASQGTEVSDKGTRTDITMEKLLADTEHGVIRFYYIGSTKGHGDKYVYATRDKHITSLYDADNIKGTKQSVYVGKASRPHPTKAPTMIKLFDINAGIWKKYKFANFLAVHPDGTQYAVCDADNDAWFDLMKGYADATSVVVGDKFNVIKSKHREEYELTLAEETVMNGGILDPKTEKLLATIQGLADKSVRTIANNLAHSVIPENVQTLVATGKNGAFRQAYLEFVHGPLVELSKQENSIFNGVTISPKLNRVAAICGAHYATIGTDTICLHPYYAVNLRTGNVIYDTTGIVGKCKAGKQLQELHDKLPDNACKFEKEFNPYLQKFAEALKLSELEVPSMTLRESLNLTFQRRMERLLMLSECRNTKTDARTQEQQQLVGLLDKIGVTNMALNDATQAVRLSFHRNKYQFEVNPNMLILKTKKGEPDVLVFTKKESRALTDWRESLAKARKKYKGDKELVKILRDIEDLFVNRIFNLRIKHLATYKGKGNR